MVRKVLPLFAVVVSSVIFFFYAEHALAGCEYSYDWCRSPSGPIAGACPPGYSCGSSCTCSGGSFFIIGSDCTVSGGWCTGDSGLSATQVCQRDICGGGPAPTSCIHTTCGGSGPAGYGCAAQSDVWCDQRNTLGQYGGTSTEAMCKGNGGQDCNWDRIPNENVGKCSGHSCTVYCSQVPADYSCEQGGCTLIKTDTTNTCKTSCTLSGSCGQPTCQNECGGTLNCGTYVSCCTAVAPTSPAITAPANGAQYQNLQVTVSWSAPSKWGNSCTGGSNSYTLFCDPSNPSPTTSRYSGTDTSFFYSNLSYSTTYYCKVRASNGQLSTNSPVSSFTTRSTAYFQTFGGNVFSKGMVKDAYLPAGKYISGR